MSGSPSPVRHQRKPVVGTDIAALADRLIAAYDRAETLLPITTSLPGFGVADGYGVLAEIEGRRRAEGWRSVGRKIGFTIRSDSARTSDANRHSRPR